MTPLESQDRHRPDTTAGTRAFLGLEPTDDRLRWRARCGAS